VLTVKDIVDLMRQDCVETYDRIFTPVVTLWTFLSQMHSNDPSCRAAVARLNATRVAQGLVPCSPLTGGYCLMSFKRLMWPSTGPVDQASVRRL
jgi:hypothetical protein